MVKYISIVFVFISVVSCFPKRFNQKYFKLNHNIEINQINIDGYYYSIFDYNNSYSKYMGQGIVMRVFLKNGYMYIPKIGYGDQCGDSISLECDIKMSEYMLNRNINEFLKNTNEQRRPTASIWNWGKYEIKNDTIFIQWFYNHRGDYYLIEEEGKIIDSTSFKLYRIKDYRTKHEKEIDEFYRFKRYNVSKIYDKSLKVCNHYIASIKG
ncbi:hypothetical protein KRX57_08325 [Weeksellaceae bacterium TAE3-ERU29]|nr:hypothetical protein [Weeksellaceae bacterium TAE3-ERU29]